MKKELPALEKTATLARKCAAFAGRTGAPENLASLPFPVAGATGLRIAVFLAQATPVDGSAAQRVMPPRHVVYALAMTGAFVELAAIRPSDFGLDHAADEPLGEVTFAADRISKRERFFDLLDQFLPMLAIGRLPGEPSAKKVTRDLRELFHELAEPPLLPYYRALGGRFLTFLERAAAP